MSTNRNKSFNKSKQVYRPKQDSQASSNSLQSTSAAATLSTVAVPTLSSTSSSHSSTNSSHIAASSSNEDSSKKFERQQNRHSSSVQPQNHQKYHHPKTHVNKESIQPKFVPKERSVRPRLSNQIIEPISRNANRKTHFPSQNNQSRVSSHGHNSERVRRGQFNDRRHEKLFDDRREYEKQILFSALDELDHRLESHFNDSNSSHHHSNSYYESFPQGYVSTYTGTAQYGGKDGHRLESQYTQPLGLAFSPNGDLFISERGRNRIRMVDEDGYVSLFAGTAQSGLVEGNRLSAQFSRPNGICFSQIGHLYICDSLNDRIRVIDHEGMVSTFAGSIQGDFDGPRLSSRLYHPSNLVITNSNDIIFSDSYNNKIKKICHDTGNIVTIAAMKESKFVPNAFDVKLNVPRGLTLSPRGDLIICNSGNNTIERITREGRVERLAGVAIEGHFDGRVEECKLASPKAAIFSNDGSLFISDCGNNSIRVISPDMQYITTYAGNGSRGSSNGEKKLANFNFNETIAFGPSGDLFIADHDNHRIKRIKNVSKNTFNSPPRLNSLLKNEQQIQHSFSQKNQPIDENKTSLDQQNLNESILAMTCPYMLTEDGKEILKSLKREKTNNSAFNALLNIIYGTPLSEIKLDISNPLSDAGRAQDLQLSKMLKFEEICELFVLLASFEMKNCLFHFYRFIQSHLTLYKQDDYIRFILYLFSRFGYLSSNSAAKSLKNSNENLTFHSSSIINCILIHCINHIENFLTNDLIHWKLEIGQHCVQFANLIFENFSRNFLSSTLYQSDLYDDNITECAVRYTMEPQLLIQRSLKQRFCNLILNEQNNVSDSNFTVIIDGGQRIACDDWALMARWPFINQVIQFGGLEKHKKCFEFPKHTFTSNMSKFFLKYIYTGDCRYVVPGLDFELTKVDLMSFFEHCEFFEIWNQNLDDFIISGFEQLVLYCIEHLEVHLNDGIEHERDLKQEMKRLKMKIWWKTKAFYGH